MTSAWSSLAAGNRTNRAPLVAFHAERRLHQVR